uniref:Uncharacterized protein n=1 Tax=Anopheles culicifacies TaxID=139723 RepID=A0A182MVI2_9DIPT
MARILTSGLSQPIISPYDTWWHRHSSSRVLNMGIHSLHTSPSCIDVLYVCYTMHQIRRNSGQIFVGKFTRREYMYDVRRLCASWCRYIDNTSCLFLLQVGDKASLQIVLLLQHIHAIASAR